MSVRKIAKASVERLRRCWEGFGAAMVCVVVLGLAAQAETLPPARAGSTPFTPIDRSPQLQSLRGPSAAPKENSGLQFAQACSPAIGHENCNDYSKRVFTCHSTKCGRDAGCLVRIQNEYTFNLKSCSDMSAEVAIQYCGSTWQGDMSGLLQQEDCQGY